MKSHLLQLLPFLLLMHFPKAFCQTDTISLNTITYLSIGDDNQMPEDSLLTSHIRIERISKAQFMEKKTGAANYMIADTLKITKTNGIIKLPIKSGFFEFRDKDVLEESRNTHYYIGQIPFLNAYIIESLYWEDLEFRLISKTDGSEIMSFLNLPIVSADRKNIIAVYPNVYETESDFELFSIKNKKPISVFRAGFKHWMPGPSNDMFWGNDGCFYLPILYATQYWKTEGDVNSDYLYAKITLID